jgi:type II secretory pathway pseudopilin PulG
MRCRIVRRGSRAAAFTLMEALIALLLLFISVLGMGALAGSAVRSNLDAQQRTEATNLAEKMLSLVRIEALGWNETTWTPANDTYMPLLNQLDTSTETHDLGGFREMTQDIPPDGTQGFDRNLAMVDLDAADASTRVQYCVHYNLTWLQPNETIRAEVRVYWLRRRANPDVIGEFIGDCGTEEEAEWAANIVDLRSVTTFEVIGRDGGAR